MCPREESSVFDTLTSKPSHLPQSGRLWTIVALPALALGSHPRSRTDLELAWPWNQNSLSTFEPLCCLWVSSSPVLDDQHLKWISHIFKDSDYPEEIVEEEFAFYFKNIQRSYQNHGLQRFGVWVPLESSSLQRMNLDRKHPSFVNKTHEAKACVWELLVCVLSPVSFFRTLDSFPLKIAVSHFTHIAFPPCSYHAPVFWLECY